MARQLVLGAFGVGWTRCNEDGWRRAARWRAVSDARAGVHKDRTWWKRTPLAHAGLSICSSPTKGARGLRGEVAEPLPDRAIGTG